MRGQKGRAEQPATLTDWARRWSAGILEPLARLIARTGVSPNAVTVTGLALNAGVAWVLAQGHMRVGGLLVALAGLFDALDGTLARLTGQKSRFGAFLDSFVDRLCEAALYLGLLVFYTRRGARQEIVLIYATIVGSLLISYARARAEGLGLECKVGLLTRMERAAILALALLLDRMSIALWVLAVLTNFTALQRAYHVWRATRGES